MRRMGRGFGWGRRLVPSLAASSSRLVTAIVEVRSPSETFCTAETAVRKPVKAEAVKPAAKTAKPVAKTAKTAKTSPAKPAAPKNKVAAKPAPKPPSKPAPRKK